MKKFKPLFLLLLLLKLTTSKSQVSDSASVTEFSKKFENLSVDADKAEKLIANYRKKRYRRFKRFPVAGTKYDSRSCWFDIEKFGAFVKLLNDFLQEKANKTGEPPSLVSGFRLYYITYDKDDSEAPLELKQRDRTLNKGNTKKVLSLLIVPTQLSNDVQTDIIEYSADGKHNRVAALMLQTEIKNQGTLCPPLPPSSCRGTTLMMLADENY